MGLGLGEKLSSYAIFFAIKNHVRFRFKSFKLVFDRKKIEILHIALLWKNWFNLVSFTWPFGMFCTFGDMISFFSRECCLMESYNLFQFED